MGYAADRVIEKVQALSPEQLAKVEALIAVLQAEELGGAVSLISEPAFAAVYNNPARR